MTNRPPSPSGPLSGVRVLSLCLNLPGPAALMRLRALGARCTKLEHPSQPDPMLAYCPTAYRAMHQGIGLVHADLKSVGGQQRLERELQRCDLLLTSFRPSALKKLGLGWPQLHRRWPQLSQVAIVGATGEHWQADGLQLLMSGDNQQLVIPEYGAPVHITQQRK